jgi:hypothetical protein
MIHHIIAAYNRSRAEFWRGIEGASAFVAGAAAAADPYIWWIWAPALFVVYPAARFWFGRVPE